MYKVNRNLKIGFILGVLQFVVYFSGYDYLFSLGPFVAHHILELPAFFFMGMGFSEFFFDLNYSSFTSQILNILIYLLNIIVTTGVRSRSSILAAFIVSFPELVGFYYYRILLSQNS